MTTFNLRDAVKTILRNSDEADPGVLADEVSTSILDEDLRDALRYTLRSYVREIIRAERNKPFGSGHELDDTHPRDAAAGDSWKVNAIQDYWQKRLRDRIAVGGSEWKMLFQCTFDDLMIVADERRELAERNAAWAVEYSLMADAIKEAGVTTFGEVPATVQEQILGDSK